MKQYSSVALLARNFRCFGQEPQGFDEIRRLNVIIGRNNTGKSALLDLVRFAVSPFDLESVRHRRGSEPAVLLEKALTEADIVGNFSSSTSGGGIPGNHLEYGKTLIGSRMRIELPASGTRSGEFTLNADYPGGASGQLQKAARKLNNPLENKRFASLTAERDIASEAFNQELSLTASGSGATNIIQRIINDEALPSDLVEVELLGCLNEIMGPDAEFSRLTTQFNPNQFWTVYLDEPGKGRISLSDSGSGLKTVLLVLVNMLLLPKLESRSPSEFVYAFEELENNLHPGLQRRLLRYILNALEETDSVAFITTHASAVIDMFSSVGDAQILHVVHDGVTAHVRQAASTPDGHGILDDLDIRASDLLQANGIVWVEGISDAIYIRRWIELYCEGNGLPVPAEGSEFSFMEYGGRCLNHLDFTAAKPDEIKMGDAEWLLPALALSRHTFVVMDSDKKAGNSPVNDTKCLAAQASEASWITQGREIENYVPDDIAQDVFGNPLKQYERASTVHEECGKGTLDKKLAALAACDRMDQSNWLHRDLEERIKHLFETIASWNPAHNGLPGTSLKARGLSR